MDFFKFQVFLVSNTKYVIYWVFTIYKHYRYLANKTNDLVGSLFQVTQQGINNISIYLASTRGNQYFAQIECNYYITRFSKDECSGLCSTCGIE